MTEPVNGRSDDPVYLDFTRDDYEHLARLLGGKDDEPEWDYDFKPAVVARSDAESAAIAAALAKEDRSDLIQLLGGRKLMARANDGPSEPLDLTPERNLSKDLTREDFNRLTEGLGARTEGTMRLPTGMPSQFGRAEAMKQFSRAILPQDKDGRVQITGTVMLDSAQLRYINGTSQRMGLPYVLDTRLNTMLDSGGLHLLSLESVYRDKDGEAIVKAYTYIKLAYVIEPVSVYLSVRMRDWLQLKPAKETAIPDGAPPSIQTVIKGGYTPPIESTQFNLTMSDVAPDDRTVWGNP